MTAKNADEALAEWLAKEGLPTHLRPEQLLKSPDSLSKSQRKYLHDYIAGRPK